MTRRYKLGNGVSVLEFSLGTCGSPKDLKTIRRNWIYTHKKGVDEKFKIFKAILNAKVIPKMRESITKRLSLL